MTDMRAKCAAAGRARFSLQICGVALAVGVYGVAGAESSARDRLRSADAMVAEAFDQVRGQFEAGRYLDIINTLKPNAASATNVAALVWLGRAHLELRDYAAAIVDLERAVALAPNDSEAHRWLGRAYGEEADRARSLSLARRVRVQFEEAVRLDSTNLAAHRDLLEFHLEAPWVAGGSDRRARRELDEIAALDPAAGHLARAAYFKHHDDVARAAAEYAAVLESRPANIDYAFEVAEFYEQAGDAPGLRAAIEAAMAVNAADPRELYYRGASEVIARGDTRKAELALKAYLTVPSRSDRPSAVQTHEWLGRLYEYVGSRPKAIAEYGKALALAPERKSAKEALRRLNRTEAAEPSAAIKVVPGAGQR
jgi:tetratricopeptide (TPR) repeat protein